MNEPVAWTNQNELDKYRPIIAEKEYSIHFPIPLYTHPAKTQLNLVNVVKNHIKDLQNCVKLFRSAEMDNTADEMEVAIKELEDAINSHPAKTLTDEEIEVLASKHLCYQIEGSEVSGVFNFARAILRKAQEK